MKSCTVYISKMLLFLFGLLFVSTFLSVKSYAYESPLYKSMDFRINGAPVGSVIEIIMIDDDNISRQERVVSVNVKEEYQTLKNIKAPSLYGDFDGGSISIEGSASSGYSINFNKLSIYRQTPWLKVTGTVLKGYDVSNAQEAGIANSVIDGANKSLAEPFYEGSIPVNENGELNKYVGLSFNSAEINYICSPHKYRVVYDSNATNKQIDSGYVNYGDGFNVLGNSFTRDGFNFKGWSLDKNNASKLYNEGDSLKNLTENDMATIYFYAIWERKDWDIFLINSSQNKESMLSKNLGNISRDYFQRDYFNRSQYLKNKDIRNRDYRGEYSVTKQGVIKN